MNPFAKAIIRMSESTMQNSSYVRGLFRTYGIPVSRSDNSSKD
ncbi:hypothetical protein [Candidatus Agathobaculum pullicola]